MKHAKSFITGILVAFAFVWAANASAGILGFKTDLTTALTNNFTAAQRQTIANSFVSAYQGEWNARVAAGTADTPANRGAFATDKIVEHVQSIVKSEQYKAALQAVATPTPLPDTD